VKLLAASIAIAAGVFGLVVASPIATSSAATPSPKPLVAPAWAWCGVNPDDPAALATVTSLANDSGIDATFGPCDVPSPGYTPANTLDRYVDAPTYMRLVKLNAQVGMKTVVYDQRIWSDDPAVRTTALAFWASEYAHIAAWDMGDEFDPNKPEWAILIHRWNIVLTDAYVRSGVRPFANHFASAVGKALTDLPGSGELISFTRYDTDRGVSVVNQYGPKTKNLMCGVNAFKHFQFNPSPASITSDMQLLLDAGCKLILVFGGVPVYGTEGVRTYGNSSLVDQSGKATTWAPAVVKGAVIPDKGMLPLPPARLLETRSGPDLATVDGVANGLGLRERESVTELVVAGRGGVAADAAAVALNVTVTEPQAAGFLTVFPCGIARPNAATVNYVSGATVSNGVITQIGPNGKVCVFTKAAAHLVVDVNGYQPPPSRYVSLAPARLFESRLGPDLATVDGQFYGVGLRDKESVTELVVTGRGGVADDAKAVALNVTVTEPRGAGFVTVYPCGVTRPNAATVNYTNGATVSNSVIAQIGIGGKVCVFAKTATHVVVDVVGYQPPSSRYVSLTPARLLESRSGPDLATVDGVSNGLGLRDAESVTVLQISGRGGVGDEVAAVVLNVTVTEPQGAGFVTVFPCGITRPNAASVNYANGETVSNGVIAQVSSDGKVCLFTKMATHLVVDVNGYQPPSLTALAAVGA
jgi:hypothetical protein